MWEVRKSLPRSSSAVAVGCGAGSTEQLRNEGTGLAGLSAQFDKEWGRITLWLEGAKLPYAAECTRFQASWESM